MTGFDRHGQDWSKSNNFFADKYLEELYGEIVESWKNRLGLGGGSDKSNDIIKQIIELGTSKSIRFFQLINEAGISEKNFMEIISLGPVLQGQHSSGQIILPESNTVEQNVLVLTHELTNLINAQEFERLDEQVALGLIEPDEYSRSILIIEAKGALNKIIVSAQSGISFDIEQEGYSKATDAFKSNPGRIDEIREEVKEAMIDSGKTKDGILLYQLYKEQGQQMRSAYLKLKKQ